MCQEIQRVCNKCKIEKSINDYYKRDDRSWKNTCKVCDNIRRSEQGKKNYQQDKDYHRKRNAQWERKNKEKRKQQHHEYYLKNKEKLQKRNRRWMDNKMKEDVGYKLICRTRMRMCEVFRKINTRKIDRTLNLVGCTAFELKAYIESKFTDGMTWDKFGYGPGKF